MAANKVYAHRCRFVDYNPSAVTALAFPHLPPILPNGLDIRSLRPPLLAVGHANGNIDLHLWTCTSSKAQSAQGWVHLKTLVGHVGTKVDHLVMVIKDHTARDLFALSNLRLFSSGGGSELLEWDSVAGSILRTTGSQGGSIWSMAVNPFSTHLALGCEDGIVRIFSIRESDGVLLATKRLDRIKSRPLSLAWGPPSLATPSSAKQPAREDDSDSDTDAEEEEGKWEDTYILVGCSDSSIRKLSLSTSRVTARMTTDRARGQRTLVWTVGVLSDGTVISGDSLGMVKFWDTETSTQIASYTAHGADVLCLAIGPDGTTLYTTGVDQKIAQFSLVRGTNNAPGKWIHNFSRRWHSHDVRALVTWPSYRHTAPSTPNATSSTSTSTSKSQNSAAPYTPLLLSGGMDMSICICPIVPPTSSSQSTTSNSGQTEYTPLLTSHSHTHPHLKATFENGYYRRMPFGQTVSPIVSVASSSGNGSSKRSKRMILCRSDQAVSLWGISSSPFVNPEGSSEASGTEKGTVDDNPPWEKLAEIALKVTTNLVSSGLSPDGRWIVVGDWYETKLFRVVLGETDEDSDSEEPILIKRVKNFNDTLLSYLPPSSHHGGIVNSGASYVTFTPDSRRMVLGLSAGGGGAVVVIDLFPDAQEEAEGAGEKEYAKVVKVFLDHSDGDEKVIEREFEREGEVEEQGGGDVEMVDDSSKSPSSARRKGGKTRQLVTVQRLAVSPDGQWLASSDDRRRVHIFNLDSIKHHTTLPSLPHLPTTLTFDPLSPSTLYIGLANNTIQIFDVETRLFPEWSSEVCRNLPRRLTGLADPVMGLVFSGVAVGGASGAGERKGSKEVVAWGTSWMCKISLISSPSSQHGSYGLTNTGAGGKKRPRERDAGQSQTQTQNQNLVQAHSGTGEKDDLEVINRYRNILFVDYLTPKEMVIVERPIVDVLRELPPAYFRHKYGS